jgi:hypothetical protein
MPVTLESLPFEIFRLIAEKIDRQCDRAAFASCSWLCYRAVSPELYRRISHNYGPPNINQRTCSLVRTLLSKPLLRRFIQTLIIEHWYADYDMDHPDLIGANNHVPIDVKLLEPAVESANYPNDRKSAWLHDLKSGYVDAHAALILTLVPNLREFEFTAPPVSLHVLRVINRATGVTFSRLQRVVVGRSDDIRALRYEDVLPPFFKLPSVRHLEVCSPAEDSGDFYPHAVDVCRDMQFESPVTHLKLMESMAVRNLELLVRRCRCLKSFIFIHYLHEIDQAAISRTRYILSALDGSRASLETLRVQNYGRVPGRCAAGFLGPFIRYTALKDLEIPAYFLLDLSASAIGPAYVDELLPPSLQSLRINKTSDESLHMLCRYFFHYSDTPPAVRLNLPK